MTALLHIIGGILAVLLLFFLAIMIHEFGHFIAARRLGFKVDAFSICFGPALWKKVVDGVEYRIGCIPLGGYVALPQLDPSSMNVIQGGAGKGAGKNGKPANAEDPKAGGAVARQDAPPPMPAWRRIVVAVAGPAGNIALAAALAIAIAALAPQSDFGGQGTTVGALTGKRAEECGIHTGDEIVAIGDQPVAFWSDIVVECHLAGDTDSGIAATVRRDGSELTLTLPLERDESSGFVGLDGISPLRETEIASIAGDSPASRSRLAKGDRVLSINGTAPASPSEAVALVRAAGTNAVAVCVARSGSDAPVMVEITPEFDAVLGRHVLGVVFADPASSIPQWMTYRSPWKQLSSDAKSIFRMLRALVAPKTPGEQKRAASGMGGPGTLLFILWNEVHSGFFRSMAFLRFLCINLAILNLLPLPVLDGGHVLFALVEIIARRRPSQKFVEYVTTAFAAMLIALMATLLLRDAVRIHKFVSREQAPDSAPAAVQAQEPANGRTVVKVDLFYNPNKPSDPTTRQLIRFMRGRPDVEVRQWAGIKLPSSAKSSLMMSIAGGTAPDIGESWFHIIRQEVRQGFLYPLNEWIGDDLDGNGSIDDDEAKWEGWRDVPQIMRDVATVDGKVYGIPEAKHQTEGLIYRTDIVEAAGLDPKRPPETWSEFLRWCRALTDPGRALPGVTHKLGQRAFQIEPTGYAFLPWIRSAGGEPVVQIRKSPKTGKPHRFPQNETRFITPEGEDLSREKSTWRCELDTPASMRALAFYHKLRWGRWIRTPDGPIDLDEADARGIAHSADDVIVGVCRNGLAQGNTDGVGDMMSRGEIAIAMVQDVGRIADLGVDPNLLSWFPYPADDGMPLSDVKGNDVPFAGGGRRTVQTFNHFAVMYPGVGGRPREERDAIWAAMTAICDDDVRNSAVESKILAGLGRFVAPSELVRLGYSEYLRDIPAVIQRNWEQIDNGEVESVTEPWSGFWHTIDSALWGIFGRFMGSLGENFDYVAEMRELTRKANSGIMFETPEEVLRRYRPWAAAILFAIGALFATLAVLTVKAQLRRGAATGSHSVHSGWLPFLLVVPAVGLILVWRYYPLARGLAMAFQDYKISGSSRFVGLDNFINLAIDPSFWKAMGRTCYYVALNMALAFTAPILLAIMLTEIRHLKIFYRTLFFLPQMSSGLVITLMWRLMYNPTPAGFFNQLIGYLNRLPFVNIPSQAWLEDPSIAMICCIAPTIWAGMGMGSLLYLAALRSIPPDLYEAAEIDGAGFRQKLFRITLPTLMPLIIINFVGTFIGTFQNMGNILLMTFGGPGEATTVIGLKIWQEAYVNLRFGMATAMACILGTMLIGLTYLQIRFLGKVEYRRAADN